MSQRNALENMCRSKASWYPVDDRRIVARVLGDLKLVVDSADMSLTPHLVMDGFWESWVSVWAASQCRADDRLLNIGANCGYFTMLFARVMQRVVAVEPQPWLAENIKLSAALNGFGGKVEVKQCVAGVERRFVTLQLHKHFGGSAFVGEKIEDDPDWDDHYSTQEVPSHELMPDATCAFIDAEGYEPLIWEGLKPMLDKKQLRWVALEWSPSRYENPLGFLQSLSKYGNLAVVKEQGQEVAVRDDQLLAGTEWDTLVVRRRDGA